MSRCGYSDDLEPWELIKWRGQVASAIRGRRGQKFLRELLAALDALPEKRLIAHDLEANGGVCALGSVGKLRGIGMEQLDPEDHTQLAAVFGVAHQLIQEIEFENDDGAYHETPEQRWYRMHTWIAGVLRAEEPPQ